MREELESLAAMAEPGELGNLTRAAEEARAARSWTWMEQSYRDAQYGFRAMRHNPGFTATAILCLALGIGANTAIFSLIDALMLRWLPVRDPQELVQLKLRTPRATRAAEGESFSYAIVKGLADEREIFSGVAGFSRASFDVGPGAWVTGDYYETLGLNPAMGRLLTRADDQQDAPPAAVISYGYWERRFARNPAAVGQSVLVNGVPVTIAGVSPPGFEGADVGAIADITLPVAALSRVVPEAAALLRPGNFWLRILARPRKGISMAQVRARLAVAWPPLSERVISANWTTARKKEMAESTFDVVAGGTGYTQLRELFRKPLTILMIVVGLVLLMSCANVANLLLARATARQREISVRLAIGAGRGRIVRQLLTESTLLSLLGAALGICLAWGVSRLLIGILSTGPVKVVFDLTPNWHVLGFTSAVAIATAILFGLAPAVLATAGGPSPALKDDTRMTRGRSRLLRGLVSAQIAISLMLLVAAGLFMRTMQNLLSVDPGFRREGVLLVDVDGEKRGYRDTRLAVFYQELLDRVRRAPGVVSASISSTTPLSGFTWSEAAVPKGQKLPENDNAIFLAVGPRFFATMETPLISGREFDTHDQGNANVAIVSQAFAARYFPGKNPLGQYLSATVTRPPSDLEIVGVAKDVITIGSLRSNPKPAVYVSVFQRLPASFTLEVRAARPLSLAVSAIRRELQPGSTEVRTLTEQVERTLVQERLMASLAGGFGVLGLVLACVGLYGLLAYSVARRTKEIGVRMALGAHGNGVLWMVCRSALGLVGLGLAFGLPAAWLSSRWVRSMLFGLKATDPGTLTAAALLLGAAGLMAAYFPARRAARVDPATALRHE